MTIVHTPTKFRVAPAPDRTIGPDMWMITEDGYDHFTARWHNRKAAQTCLDNARAAAARIASHGYFVTPDPYRITVRVDHTPIEVLLPYGCTPTIRTNCIKAAVVRHILDGIPA